MTILALEFSAELRSAAVLAEGREPSSAAELKPREYGPMTLIERALAGAGIEREAIEVIVVGLGPGSYTGIRAAIAVAQGWQLGRNVRLMGLSSMEVLAAQAQASGARGRIHFVADALRGEFYWIQYQIGPVEREVVQSLRLAAWQELEVVIAQGEAMFGPDLKLCERGVQYLVPQAATLARLCVGRKDEEPTELEPLYLRATSFVKAPPARVIPPVGEGRKRR